MMHNVKRCLPSCTADRRGVGGAVFSNPGGAGTIGPTASSTLTLGTSGIDIIGSRNHVIFATYGGNLDAFAMH